MGIDYYTCANCGRAFPDYDYFLCECGEMFCSNKCGERRNSLDLIDPDDYDTDEEYEEALEKAEECSTCVICRQEVITDDNLLEFLLQHCKLTRDQAEQMYKDANN